MNKFLYLIIVFLAIVTAYNFYQVQTSSALVYVDVSKLIEGYHKTKTVKAELKKKSDALKKTSDSLMSDWQEELKNYELERSSLSAKDIELRQELLVGKQQKITLYQEATQQKMVSNDKTLTKTLIDDINHFIKEYGKANNYKIIFGASGGGNIMYADESTDLTEEVLKGLNQQYENK